MNKRLFGAFLGSIGISSVLLAYWLGLAVGANRFGDIEAHNVVMKIMIPVFFGSTTLTSWLLHAFLDGLPKGEGGRLRLAAQTMERLPVGLRIIGELAFGVVAPVVVVVLPMAIAAPWM
jgi:hypothetical protein